VLVCYYFKVPFYKKKFLALFCYCLKILTFAITFLAIFYYYVEVLSYHNFFLQFCTIILFFYVNPNHEKIENVVINNSVFICFFASTKVATL
jgi:hypothetical protein